MLSWRCSTFLFLVLATLRIDGGDALTAEAGKAGRMHLRSSGVVEGQQEKAAEPAPAPAPAPSPAGAPGPAPAPAAGVATALSADAPAGATTIEVESSEGFGVGDTILIGNVSSGEVETKAVLGFGSIILDSPLAKAYPKGTAVTVAAFLQAPLPTTSTTLNPVAQTVAEMDEMVKAEKEVLNPTDPLSILKEQLSANVWLQEELEEKQDSLKEEVYRAKLANDVEAVARETTPGVAQMLGDMRRQMHSLAAPFYVKAIDGQLKDLKAREKSLLEQISAAESAPESTTPAPVKKEVEKVEVQKPEEPESTSSSETSRLYVICFVMLLGMIAICCVLSARRRRNAQA